MLLDSLASLLLRRRRKLSHFLTCSTSAFCLHVIFDELCGELGNDFHNSSHEVSYVGWRSVTEAGVACCWVGSLLCMRPATQSKSQPEASLCPCASIPLFGHHMMIRRPEMFHSSNPCTPGKSDIYFTILTLAVGGYAPNTVRMKRRALQRLSSTPLTM
ncbi:hypothetical protein BDY19DRAFT_723741 [Irpex rosettiformis]|uniref:Uncharacterized protein n=1 Tax=Irpex rosettiformis TaxID=378272 RepID=A0ACB8U8F1_9APHY|nr:hypothetical protein BDY19DRAFT_723741 [Irpex rosettiformis]